ncbi:MAG: CCA tRNA nucleotidyltransferase [Clostridia bacterium]|nr:CCA tRNA nucleotidyltransferase [Clostridia bacterium]
MIIEMPHDVELIISRLNQNGFNAYAVGGCVRDSLMNKVPQDWDICTSASPKEIISIFSDYKTLTIGEKHGTITVIVNHVPYEVTTFRIDGEYHDNRRPDNVEFVSDLHEDLKRRDFTVNAIAYHPEEGLIDPFNGYNDIKNKIIRCVGEPDKRFGEDALRIMRALRFSAVLGFEIEDKTSKSISKNKEFLKNIAVERIRSEFEKILLSDNISTYLEYSDIFECTFGKPSHSFTGIVTTLEKNLSHRLAAYYSDCTDTLSSILHNLKFDKKTVLRTCRIVLNRDIEIRPDTSHLRHLISIYGYETVYDILSLRNLKEEIGQLQNIKEKNLCCSISQLDINGNDLSDFASGKQIGYILKKLLELVITEETENKKDALIKRAKYIKECLE